MVVTNITCVLSMQVRNTQKNWALHNHCLCTQICRQHYSDSVPRYSPSIIESLLKYVSKTISWDKYCLFQEFCDHRAPLMATCFDIQATVIWQQTEGFTFPYNILFRIKYNPKVYALRRGGHQNVFNFLVCVTIKNTE